MFHVGFLSLLVRLGIPSQAAILWPYTTFPSLQVHEETCQQITFFSHKRRHHQLSIQCSAFTQSEYAISCSVLFTIIIFSDKGIFLIYNRIALVQLGIFPHGLSEIKAEDVFSTLRKNIVCKIFGFEFLNMGDTAICWAMQYK